MQRNRIILNGAACVLLTLFLLAFCTWGELAILRLSGVHRPYTILYLTPVAIGAALLGVRGGIITALLAVALARLYLFTDNKHGLSLISFPSLAEGIEFAALLTGTLTIAFITGRLRTVLGDLGRTNRNLRDANARLTESEEQRRVFNRDVLLAVTGGKLRLVDADEMPPPDLVTQPPLLTLPLREPADASALRHALLRIAGEAGMEPGRVSDLSTAATEAATNAIKHGNGGSASVWRSGEAVMVQVGDNGTGIAPAQLARATLEQGFSTRVSLGMGFHLMLQSSDTLALSTDPSGTVIFLQVFNKPRVSEEDAVLSRYARVTAPLSL